MDIKDRLKVFINYLGYDNARFEREAGLSNGFVRNTNANMRKASLQLILNRFPQLNENWLVNGRGDMLKQVPTNSIVGDNGSIDNSYNKHMGTNSDALTKIILEQSKAITRTQEQLSKAQEQIDRLLNLLEQKGGQL